MSAPAYAELQVTSNFSFLRGASAAEELFAAAAAMGIEAMRGRVQREGEVVHLVAHRIVDLSRDLASVGQREAAAAEKQGPVAGGIRVKARDFR